MPLTCSHPAAILPFKRYTRLDFPALVIGSMSPDFGYFIGQRYLAKLAHRPFGTVLICVPTGLLVYALFQLIRRDFCYLLPSPHRNQLMPLAQQRKPFTGKRFITLCLSLLLGVWTHVIWDQFTHDGSYIARHFAPLRTVLFYIGKQEITISYVLQYISTIVGAAILAIAYLKWLRSQPPKPDNQSDTWRYLLIATLALISLAIGTAIAIHLSPRVHDFHTFRDFFYKTGVTSVSMFTILTVTAAILCYTRRPNQSDM